MGEAKDFLIASVGASAAFIGLLFVAITIAPEQTFGEGADSRRQLQATGAFTALGNIFFVSLAGLLPLHAGVAIAFVALFSVGETVSAMVSLWRRFPELRGRRAGGLASLLIYLLELVLALRFAFFHGSFEGLLYTTLGLYGFALATCWQLLGGERNRP